MGSSSIHDFIKSSLVQPHYCEFMVEMTVSNPRGQQFLALHPIFSPSIQLLPSQHSQRYLHSRPHKPGSENTSTGVGMAQQVKVLVAKPKGLSLTLETPMAEKIQLLPVALCLRRLCHNTHMHSCVHTQTKQVIVTWQESGDHSHGAPILPTQGDGHRARHLRQESFFFF